MSLSRVVVAWGAAIGLLTAPIAPSGAVGLDESTTSYLIDVAPSASAAEVSDLVESGGGDVTETLTEVIEAVSADLTASEAEALLASPEVDAIYEHQPITLTDTQTDAPWNLSRLDQSSAPADTSYTYPTSAGRGVPVYIVDTGVSPNPAQYQSRLLPGQNFAADRAVGSASPDTSDCDGHGSHVAGTVGSTTYGVAKAATIVPVRVFECSGYGDTNALFGALDWVATQPLGVVNLSLSVTSGNFPPLDDAVTALVNAGYVVAVAAGNNNGLDACNYSPGSARSVLTVGATTSTDQRASYSNIGPCIDLFAPGSSIPSLSHTSAAGSVLKSGTSMATPHVAGVAALIWSAENAASGQTIQSRLTSNASSGLVGTPGAGSPNLLLNSRFTLNSSPRGDLNRVTGSFGQARLQGWIHDEDTTEPVAIHAYVGGPSTSGSWAGSFVANVLRTDVSAAFPGIGPNHGFDFIIPLPQGSTTVCLYAINVGFGVDALIGCPVISLPTGSPFGSIDAVGVSPGQASFSGWVIDPDTADGVEIRASADGAVVATTIANTLRPDVGGVYAGYGPNHGFAITVPLTRGGAQTICLTAVNAGPTAPNSSFGCRTVVAPGGNPFGSLDSASAALGSVNVSGWLIDPDVLSPVTLHAYVDGSWGGSYVADTLRADVGRAFPGYGDNHGYSFSIPTTKGGRQTVCLYGINIGSGTTNPLLGCRVVTAPGGNPFGNFEGIVTDGDSLAAQGWIIDPDVATAVALHVYVDGRWYGAFTANATRNDVGSAYPAYGTGHGFRVPLNLARGTHSVCVYAINIASGTTNPLMGCRTASIT